MRLSELLGSPVGLEDGTPVGSLVDLRLVHRGPVRGALQQLRVAGLVVRTDQHTWPAFGYDRDEQNAPWLLRVLVRTYASRPVFIPWADVLTCEPGRVVLTSAARATTPA